MCDLKGCYIGGIWLPCTACDLLLSPIDCRKLRREYNGRVEYVKCIAEIEKLNLIWYFGEPDYI